MQSWATCIIYCLLLLTFVLIVRALIESTAESQEEYMKGHLKPFGEQGVNHKVEERFHIPDSHDFMVSYVQQSKPVKLTGALKDSKPVREWTDQYMLNLEVHEDDYVHVRTKKIKKNGTRKGKKMHLYEFLKMYNHTDSYIVDDIPKCLRPDLKMPCSLQCKELLEHGLSGILMSFDSRGKNFSVHIKGYDSLHCVIRGQNTFILVDPKHRDKINFTNKGEYAFSYLDVDSVDLKRYPQMSALEFYRIEMEPGDCLYIPYSWIHQECTYGNNMALSFLWDHYKILDIVSKVKDRACQGQCNPHLAADQNINSQPAMSTTVLGVSPKTIEELLGFTLQRETADEIPSKILKTAEEMFFILDKNRDRLFSRNDMPLISDQDWKEVYYILHHMLRKFAAIEQGLEKKARVRERTEEL